MRMRARRLLAAARSLAGGTHAPHSLRHIGQQAGWAGVSQMAGLSLRYALVLLVGRLTGPTGLGLYALGLAFGNGGAVVARAGLDQVVVRYIPFHRARGEDGAAAGVCLFSAGLAGLLGLAVGALLFVAAPVLGAWWDQPRLAEAVRLVAPAVPALAAGQVLQHQLRGFHDARRAAFLEHVVTPAVTALGFLAVVLVRPAEPLAAVAGVTLSAWAALALGGRWVRREAAALGAAPAYPVAAWARFSAPMFLESVLLFFLGWSGSLMLGLYAGAAEVGLYTAALRLSRLASVPLLAANAAFAPTISGLHGRAERGTLQRLYAQVTYGTALAGLGIAAALGLAGSRILGLFGHEFTAAYPALLILLAGQAVNAGTGSSGFMLSMTGHPGWHLGNVAAAAGLNVLLNWLLIPAYGAAGAAVAAAASLGTVNALQVLEVQYLTGFWAYKPSGLSAWGRLLSRAVRQPGVRHEEERAT